MGEVDISEMKETCYKGFKAGNEKVKASDGKFTCPYCACKDQDYDYSSFLQQRARHSAMATYLAIDISYQSPDKYSDEEWVPLDRPLKRLRSQATKKEEFGEEIHNMVVDAVTEIHDHTFSGSCELWNFQDKRKASLVEAVHSIFKLPAAKRTSKQRRQIK